MSDQKILFSCVSFYSSNQNSLSYHSEAVIKDPVPANTDA